METREAAPIQRPARGDGGPKEGPSYDHRHAWLPKSDWAKGEGARSYSDVPVVAELCTKCGKHEAHIDLGDDGHLCRQCLDQWVAGLTQRPVHD